MGGFKHCTPLCCSLVNLVALVNAFRARLAMQDLPQLPSPQLGIVGTQTELIEWRNDQSEYTLSFSWLV